MSNTVVGPTYKHILDQVVDASATDFEESGVPRNVLDALKATWQDRLSNSGRALFPWDDLPPETKIEHNANPNPGVYQHLESSQSNAYDSPSIKQEGPDHNYLNLPPRPHAGGFGSGQAEQRAQDLLYGRFGSDANRSIAALQASRQNQGYTQQAQEPYAQYPQQSPYTGSRQQQSQQAPPNTQQQPKTYGPQVQQQNHQYQQLSQPPPQQTKQEAEPYIKQEYDVQRNGLSSAQTDGAGDATEWDAVIAVRNARGQQEPLARLEADNQIRRMIEQNAQRLEGGGLMLPLAQRRPTLRPARSTAPSSSAQDAARASSSRLGGDATADDDEEDADAINSDLDDPDDTAETNLEGVYEGDVILCLYDKVQRVKNKWKCVLREGILTIDDKDYVFHKASGEFEW